MSEAPNVVQTVSGGSLDGYPRRLFALLAVATVFEGFDTMLTSLSLHHMEGDFGADQAELAVAVSMISLGTVAAFLSLRLADRYGRRPVFLVSITGYTLLTVATAFSQTLDQFIALQFIARMLMVTELALAYVMLGEEMPERYRPRALALLGGFALCGAALPAIALPAVMRTEWGWRGLFLLGGMLLPFLPLYWRQLRETTLFSARADEVRTASLFHEVSKTLRLFQRRRLTRTTGLTAIWFTINFWTSTTLFFFPAYVQGERGWNESTIAWVVPLATLVGFFGYVIAGRAMDAIGRRPTLGIYFALGSLTGFVCYRVEADFMVGAAYFALMMLAGLWAIGETIAVELFETEVRATANGLTNNLLGRWGLVFGPAAMSFGIARTGSIGEAASWLALFNLLALPLILGLIPETRGRGLDIDT